MSTVDFIVHSEHEDCATAFSELIDGVPNAQVCEVVHDPERLEKALKENPGAALLVDLGHAPHLCLDRLEALRLQGTPLLVSGPQDDSQLILRALKMGAREFFSLSPDAGEVAAAVEKLAESLAPERPTGARAKVLAVMGTKGGVGATVVACQLAASLQRTSGPTAIVDLNFPLGDVALHFDLRPRYTLTSVLSEDDGFDADYLRTVMERHSSGVQVLAAPERVEENELVTRAHVEQVLDVLGGEVDWIVVDVSRSWNEASVRALDLADGIALVTSLDVASIDHTKKHLELLGRLGYPEKKIHLIANRQSANDALGGRDFEAFMGRKFEVGLPNDYDHAVEAVNSGKTLSDIAPKAALTRAFDDLAGRAHAWCGLEPPTRGRQTGDPISRRVRRIFKR